MSGLITFSNDTPDDFIAVSSKCSPRFPNAISDASRIDSGNAMGTRDCCVAEKFGYHRYVKTLAYKVVDVSPQELHQHNKKTDEECH